MDPSTNLAIISDYICDDDINIQTETLLKTPHIHAINIPGTVPYCKSTHHEFKYINFYNSYVKKHGVSIFRAGSLTEYHKYTLQNLLSLYTEKITGLPRTYSYLIRSYDETFTDAVQDINMSCHIIYLQKLKCGWKFSRNRSLV